MYMCTVYMHTHAPVERKAPSWSSTSSGLAAHKHSVSEAEHVARPGWMQLDLEV